MTGEDVDYDVKTDQRREAHHRTSWLLFSDANPAPSGAYARRNTSSSVTIDKLRSVMMSTSSG